MLGGWYANFATPRSGFEWVFLAFASAMLVAALRPQRSAEQAKEAS